jgi:hypothetical protein
MIRQVDRLQQSIETDTALSNNNKKRCLRNLERMLNAFWNYQQKKEVSPSIAPQLIKAFEQCLRLDLDNKSIEGIVKENEYGVGKVLVECFLYPVENSGIASARLELVLKYCFLHPDEILNVLKNYPDAYFADSLIAIAARRDIPKLYDFAQARNSLGNRIRSHRDTLVHLVSTIANNKSGRLYYPFIENLLRGKITIEEIEKVKEDEVAYFRLLVNTRIEYSGRQLPPARDTARGLKELTEMMSRKAREYFITEINALHGEDNESVRFRRLDSLKPQELYYLAVLSEDLIYTSSFVKGVYPRIFQGMANPRADSLLISVHGDYFRKFIKMCAGYNTLNDFLSRMDKKNANVLMKAFIFGLEKTNGMEEAVDVADSYSSIRDKNTQLASDIRDEIQWNLEKNKTLDNQRGIVLYSILKTLFESADNTLKGDLSASLQIPPVYGVSLQSLKDDTGRIVTQVFFYGDDDKDGQNSFSNFMALFRNKANWKVSENSEWVSITRSTNRSIQIYANKPLFGEDDPAEKAIAHLNEFLTENNLQPSIYVHRGHSYHVKSTMQWIQPSARIVILGSCGGYNNLNEVLTISPDAHIISSKQTGTMHVNEPILQSINAFLLANKNINWVAMWKELSERFRTGDAKEKFEDYIPPYKNLGAIFIKAYSRYQENGQD